MLTCEVISFRVAESSEKSKGEMALVDGTIGMANRLDRQVYNRATTQTKGCTRDPHLAATFA